MEGGIDKIRINPGNIGGEDRVEAVAKACKERGIPIRIGVNGGSLEKPLLDKYGGPTPEALVESALGHVALLEKYGFEDICISMKSSSVPTTMRAYQLMAQKYDFPLHLGVTEAGTAEIGSIKSAAGIGGLLGLGIGDTFRVTLTADPVEEIVLAKKILKAVGLRKDGPELISCPTCGRTQIDLIPMAHKVEELLKGVDKPITVAVMGCVVNGPGEAREADYGIAGGRGKGLLFKKGRVLGTYPYDELCGRVGQGVKGGKPGVHMQLHPLFRGIIRPDILLALHYVPRVKHHIIVIFGIYYLPLYHNMVAGVHLVYYALVIVRADKTGNADRITSVRYIKA